jgi:hypothetical protein
VAQVIQFGVQLKYFSTDRHEMYLKVTYIEVVVRPLQIVFLKKAKYSENGFV